MKTAIVKQLPANNKNLFKGCARQENFDLNDYVAVYVEKYDGSKTNIGICDDLFYKLNANRPEHFAGHSMSVSDIVIIIDENNNQTIYFCDSLGWEKVGA